MRATKGKIEKGWNQRAKIKAIVDLLPIHEIPDGNKPEKEA